VAKPRSLQFHVTGPARRDIAAIVKKSLQEFGEAASQRYRILIRQALLDIEADPERPGSTRRPEIMIEGARTYHTSLSRTRVNGPSVKQPRHFLLYRQREDGVIEVARILHDSRGLQRHLPEDYRPASSC
jgi:plasmid stabilization system protein ParE